MKEHEYNVIMEILQIIRDQPIHDQPTHDQPIHDQPIHNQPIHDQPIHDQPIHNQPIRNQPNIQNNIKIEGDANQITIVSYSQYTFAKKLTKMREVEGEEIPDKIEKLVEEIIKTETTVINDKDKNKILQLLEEFIDYATSPDKEKYVLRDMWHKLQKATKNVRSISQKIELMLPIISKLWIS